MMRAVAIAFVIAGISSGFAGQALAQDRVTVGLYAPAAPFSGPTERHAFVSGLAEHLQDRAGGRKVVARVFPSAASLVRAARRGDVQFAVIDAQWAAVKATGGRVLATATRDGETSGSWQLIGGASVRSLRDLAGKTVIVPRLAGREDAFIANVLLSGEVVPRFFGKVIAAPDAASAVAGIRIGRADAAFVPSGLAVEGDARRVLSLERVPWPVFMVFPSAPEELVEPFGERVQTFRAAGFSGFRPATSKVVQTLAKRFTKNNRRGTMANWTPARIGLDAVLGERTHRVKMTDLRSLLVPARPPGDASR